MKNKCLMAFIAGVCLSNMLMLGGCNLETISDYSSDGLIYELNQSEDGYIVVDYNGAGGKIAIPNTYENLPVVEIKNRVFFGYNTITGIVIGANITKIGNESFYNCTSLETLIIHNGLTTIGNYAFFGCKNLKRVDLPDSVLNLGDSAFRGCYALIEFDFGESLTRIGNEAFYYCVELCDVTIPKSVTSIGSNVFYGCAKLTEITFDDSKRWYYTDSWWQLEYKINGIEIDVEKPSANAIYFKETHNNYYWYKSLTETE